MAERKRVVTRRKKAVRKSTGKFNFTREMIPSFTNGKSEPKFITNYRDNAWEAFEKLELPTTNEEAWRRTDIRKLATDSFKIDDNREGFEISKPDLKETGVVFTDFETAAMEHPELLEKILGRIVKVEEDKFTAMAGAFSKQGVFLYVPKGVSIEEPLNSLYSGADLVSSHFTHVLVFLEENASATLVQEYASGGNEDQNLHVGITELFVGKGANLRFIEIQSWGDSVWTFTHERAHIERDGNLEWIYGATGSHLTKNFSEIELLGEGANGKMAGFYFTDGVQHLDHDTQQNHLAPNTTSDLLFKGALKDKSRSVWQGMIYVAPGAQKTDGYQSNPNLVLDKNAKADSIPGLEIMADDVRCTHGATISKIDPNEVFYLNTRGIPTDDAERLIVEGFFDPILQQIPIESIRERLQQAIVDKLR